MEKILKHGSTFTFSATIEENITELERLYNFRTRDERRRYFASWYKEEMYEIRRESADVLNSRKGE